MKKQLLKLAGGLILTLSFSLQSLGQLCALSGTYTIDPGLPADSVNYLSFTEAVNALNNCGVSGPVTFNIAAGQYSEQVSVTPVNGASAVNTITFQTDPDYRGKAELSYAASHADSNYVIQLLGASFITLRNLKISALDPTNGRVIDLLGTGSDIVIEDNELIGVSSVTPGSEATVIVSQSGSKYSKCLIRNNIIRNGTQGISFVAPENDKGRGNIVSGNIVEDYGVGGILLENQDSITVEKNELRPSLVNTYIFCGGMTVRRGVYCKIIGNKIDASVPSPTMMAIQALNVSNYDSSYVYPGSNIVANNIILLGGNLPYGAQGIGIMHNFKTYVAYNSVISTGPGSVGLTITNSRDDIRILNNNIAMPGGGIPINISSTSVVISAMDHNNFYTTGTTIGNWEDTEIATLADWKTTTSMDANSVSMDPQFMDVYDPRMYVAAMDNLGTPVPGINTDIEGNVRSSVTPDIGAWEFTAFNEDIFASALLEPLDSACGDSNSTIVVEIFNRGANAASGFNVGAVVNGQDISITYSGTLAVGSRDTVEISGFNTAEGEQLEILTYTSLTSDMNTTNDTLSSTVYIQSILAPVPVSSDPGNSFCADSPYDTLFFPEGSVSAYQWMTTEGEVLGVKNGLVVGPLNNGDTTFILSPSGNTCNAAEGSITLRFIPSPEADFTTDLLGPTETGFTVNFDGSTSENGENYEWDFGDGNTDLGDSITHVYTEDGNYDVQLIVHGKCGSDTIVKTVNIAGIGITENILGKSLKLYPNPAGDRVNFTFHAEEKGSVSVMDLTGKVVMEKDFDEISGKSQGSLDVQKLAKGVYLFNIRMGKNIVVRKFVKK